jgi:hypothetical protein
LKQIKYYGINLLVVGLNIADLVKKHAGERGKDLAQPNGKEKGINKKKKKKEKFILSIESKHEESPERGKQKVAGAGKLTEQEEIKSGSVSWAVYKRYILASGIGVSLFTLFLLLFESGFKITTDMYLSFSLLLFPPIYVAF